MHCHVQDPRLADNALRSALRLNLKYYAARILEARLFKSPERLIEVQDQMKSTKMYKMNPKSVDDVVTDDTVRLQKWVRQSFLKSAPELHTPLFQQFIDVTVRPCLSINVSDCGLEMKQMANSFTKALASEQFSRDSMEHLCVRIMEKTAKGALSSNPVPMGIVLQCLEFADRLERDVQSMKKTRVMSDCEKAVVEEAAMTLAMNGCSEQLMRSMGFNKKCVLRVYGDLDSLNGQSLPCGALALLFPETLQQNLSIIDGMYPRDQGHKRRFCLCFDSTYLLAMHQSLRLGGKRVMVGAPFRMDDLDSEQPGCYQEVVMGEQMRERSKANRMFLATNLMRPLSFFWGIQ